jgi:SAM-dependent methyltransferase
MSETWAWDPTLYAGAAPYYAMGRLPYPPEVAQAMRAELHLDGRGRLLDLGCGPATLTLVIAGLYEEAVGVDADAEMLGEARRRAAEAGITNVSWVHARAEALPADLGTFRTITLAQSFHWMDQPRVAARALELLDQEGVVVHVGGTTSEGPPGHDRLPGPTPPRDEIDGLVRDYLGPVRRAGQSLLPHGTPSTEDEVFAATGFTAGAQLGVGGGRVLARSEDEVVASVYSLSSAAPHLFGDRRPAFEADLRALLRAVSPTGQWWERTQDIVLSFWHRPRRRDQPTG